MQASANKSSIFTPFLAPKRAKMGFYFEAFSGHANVFLFLFILLSTYANDNALDEYLISYCK
jgi:hypothetical protein